MEAACSFFETNRNVLSKADEIAEAITLKTLEYIDEGVAKEDLIFNYVDIYEMVWGSKETSAKASQSVRAHIDKLDALLSENSDLNVFLANKKLQQLRLKNHRSSGHHKTTIRILTNQGNTLVDSATDDKLARYFATNLPKPYFWTKPFLKIAINLKGLIFTLILVLLALVIPIVTYLLFSGLINEFIKFFLVILFATSIYILSKIVELSNKGITCAPIFMTPITSGNVFFALQRPAKRKLEVITVVYEGKCNICGDKLLIEKSREFNNRYIGRCAISPMEHVFSFDHVTKTGKSLR